MSVASEPSLRRSRPLRWIGGAVEVWLLAAALFCAAAVIAPSASAADQVTYEVVSESVSTVDVEYVDGTGRKLSRDVSLPWRLQLTLDDARAGLGHGAQVRADWRRVAAPSRWVVVSIYSGGKLLCQSTLDVGDATCYGNTPHVS